MKEYSLNCYVKNPETFILSEIDINTDFGREYKNIYEEIKEKHGKGETLYFKIEKGDYAGSIAKLSKDTEIKLYESWTNQWNTKRYETIRIYLKGHFIWDGRRNKIQAQSYNVSYLKDYEGPTVFEKIDKKSIAQKALEEGCTDIDGNELSNGDNVLYINARYGSGMELNHGKIKEIKGTYAHGIVVIVENTAGVLSEIKNPATFIWKKPVDMKA